MTKSRIKTIYTSVKKIVLTGVFAEIAKTFILIITLLAIIVHLAIIINGIANIL